MQTVERAADSSARRLPVTGCAECERLTAGHELAKRSYANAVDVLFATGYRFKDKKYAAMKNSVEETCAQWEIAKAKLQQHKLADH